MVSNNSILSINFDLVDYRRVFEAARYNPKLCIGR